MAMGRKFCLTTLPPFHGFCWNSGETQQNAALGAEPRHEPHGEMGLEIRTQVRLIPEISPPPILVYFWAGQGPEL